MFLESLLVFLCLKYLVQPSKWRVKLGIWEVVFFPVPEEIVYSFLVYYFFDKRVSFTMTCILSRQVKILKKMVVLSAKFTILISWSPICIPLILLLALMKLASTSAAIMYKSIENRHPWQTSRVRVKGSDRRPFILILDWILVYTSLTIWWMDLSPYPNLRKAEKLKSQSTLRILQKDFYSVYLTHQLCIQQIVEGCKSSLFLIASVFHLLLYLMFFAFNS